MNNWLRYSADLLTLLILIRLPDLILIQGELNPSPAPKKQSNTPWVNLSSKLASNGKLTSDKCKKHLKNNLCLYCGAEDHKLDFCPKKQTTVSPKGRSASATADTLAAASEKLLEK